MWSIDTGSSHRCANGHRWYDSDGGPCCGPCDSCGDYVPYDEMEEIDGCYYCNACTEKEKNLCTECGEYPGGYRGSTKCEECWEEGYVDYKTDGMGVRRLEINDG